ncbi:MAG: Re/Si-specific NAD(P)(+) transhydrogenase subunit alpha [Gammaproteobacteria bacterium]|nr:Re/Si-specific NAD(P)(+) transhydrogenase subunit alpha [Gammaproteobacteria bacterium]
MRIGIPQEIHAGERRVATTPEVASKLIKLGFSVSLQKGAGIAADFSDEAYREFGVEIVDDPRSLWASADIVLKVRAPEQRPELACHEIDLLREGALLISFLWPAQNPDLMERLAARRVTALAMDSVPRISRAQKLDALSSMANIAGYRAVIEAAQHFGRFFTGQVTAAGKVPPAKVFVIGAGVAGLAAIGAANGLGAIVRAMDTRPEVKDQVKSLGADFVEVNYEEEGGGVGGYAKVMSEGYQKAQRDTTAKQCMEVDIVITTALIPGKPAPKLISAGMVEAMQDGSVIVDLAAEQGGNCELTVPGQVVMRHGVTIVGYTDMPSRMARQSSQLYSTNLLRVLEELCVNKDGIAIVNMDDEMIRGATVVKEGMITWPSPAPKLSGAPPVVNGAAPVFTPPAPKKPLIPAAISNALLFAVLGAALFALGNVAPAAFMSHFMVFVLACFVGYMVIWNVTPALHTPLMSVTNAISSIIAIGALIQVAAPSVIMKLLAGVALALTTVNMAGGFAVTQRMLRMFRRSE